MRSDSFSGAVDRNITHSAGITYEYDAIALLDVAVIYNLGFVWDGKVLHIRVLCPDSRMQPLVSYEHMLELKRRQASIYGKARRNRANARG